MRGGRFAGFSPEAFRFLAELEANNDRAWFAAHEEAFNRLWKAPLEALVQDAEPELGAGKRFRIHRDVRFSADKSPYKTHASAVFENDGLVFYLQFAKDHVFCATGMHMMAKDQLARFLAAVDDDGSGTALEAAVRNAEAAELEIGGESLKTVARGYPKDHPRARFLRHKGLTAARTWRFEVGAPPRWMSTDGAVKVFFEAWAEASDINRWLSAHVGPSREGARWVKTAL